MKDARTKLEDSTLFPRVSPADRNQIVSNKSAVTPEKKKTEYNQPKIIGKHSPQISLSRQPHPGERKIGFHPGFSHAFPEKSNPGLQGKCKPEMIILC
jgi:hypothetical protein